MLNAILLGLLKIVGVVLLVAWALGLIVCVLVLFAMALAMHDIDENEED